MCSTCYQNTEKCTQDKNKIKIVSRKLETKIAYIKYIVYVIR